MNIRIKPSVLKGKASAPASKSMAHRLLICAGLSGEESIIENIAYSEDILATLDCLDAMGAQITRGESNCTIRGISPCNTGSCVFPCRESGSTLRFLIPVAMLSKEESCFKGYGRLMERPLGVYEELAREKGLSFKLNKGELTVGGTLSCGIFRVRGDISSQFISGLLFALPLCEGDSEIILTGRTESRSYIDMTVEALRSFGISVEEKSKGIIYIKGNQSYKGRRLAVEGDYSNAAFLDAFNFLSGDVELRGLSASTLQGDSIYKQYFRLLRDGCPELRVDDCPDLAPILMTLASVLNGATLTGTSRLKIKESDRGAAMKRELEKFGADIELYDNKIVINKSELRCPVTSLYGHNDHRVVMSLTVLASVYGGCIEGAEAISKSFPDFFEKLRVLGLEAEIYDN